MADFFQGPLKLTEGTSKKADRRALAKAIDFLPYQKKDALELDQILIDIKDIIRRTLVYKDYACMAKGHQQVNAGLWQHDAGKQSQKSQGQQKADHSGLRGVAKVYNGFTKAKKPKASAVPVMYIQ